MYTAGNRDDTQFPDAERFDVCRANTKNHLAFGVGIHYCLGVPSARLEGKIAFETLLSRLTNIRLVPDMNDFTHTPSFILRGLQALHVEFERA